MAKSRGLKPQRRLSAKDVTIKLSAPDNILAQANYNPSTDPYKQQRIASQNKSPNDQGGYNQPNGPVADPPRPDTNDPMRNASNGGNGVGGGNGGSDDSSSFSAGAKFQIEPIGTSGTEIFAGYFSEEYLQQLRGRKGAKVWDEIRRSDANVKMILAAVTNPIKAATWEFEAANVPNGEQHKALIDYIAKDMIDWQTHVHEALTFIIHGFSIFEVVNNVVYNHPKFGTFNGLKALAFRSQKTIERWVVDRTTGDLDTIVQWVQGDLALGRAALINLDAQFCLVMTLEKEGDNYAGISGLRSCYGAWYRKNLYLRLMGIGIEKNALGTPMGTIPAGKLDPAQESAFREMLSNFTANESSYIVKPAGWDVTLLESKFDPEKLKSAIVLENTEMISAFVANFLALGMHGNSGAFALGDSLADFFLSGLQMYADIITGIWNRKLVPDLIKLNFGEQESYPKLKVTGINDRAGKEIAEILALLTKSSVIKADMKLEEFMRKSYKLPAADLTTTRELINVSERIDDQTTKDPNAEPGNSLSERRTIIRPPKRSLKRLKLAESYNKQWKSNKADLKQVMQDGLTAVRDDLKAQIARQFKNATSAARAGLALNIQPKTGNYKKDLQEALAQIANQSLVNAKKLTPKASKNVKLSERFQLALANADTGGYFDALPDSIKRIVKNAAGLIADTQGADIDKVVSFQYASSQATTDDLDSILNDIDTATEPTLIGSTEKGMSIDAAAGNAVSQVANQAANAWFFDPEVIDTIESFTFTNDDPQTDICIELTGTTWAVGDPDLDTYSPPLHHNCKSRLEPNEKGDDNNPDIQRGGTPVTQDGLDSITLQEHCCGPDYHLSFTLIEPKTKKRV